MVVFGFPIGAGEVEGIEEGGVGAEGVAAGAGEGIFGDEGPFKLAGAGFEESFKGGAEIALVVGVGLGKGCELPVVSLDGGVGGFEGELRHGASVAEAGLAGKWLGWCGVGWKG